ncbi:sugar phosphate isomerase/epimerase family protein [Pannonibacter carbonis]|uniref:sugar phosphate isomerase/epimerase family protein n=1 Tax=Pannonibacter carbonis TaxID=2067569 RepID=UPI000D0EDB08|nr:sugar phosphate isomerase/epimerase family protein [Pannonibacter carbonis]
MTIIATGFNTGDAAGSVATLATKLAHLAEIGATGAEITATGLDAVVACRLIPSQVAAVRAAMALHDLAYSMHAPIAINLMDEAHRDLQRRAALVSMELAAEIGARVVVLHPGRCTPLDWVNRRAELLAFERELLAEVADRAQALGVRIAYENISPNARVIDGLETSYSLDPAQLAEQLEALNHPAVVACLDISHAQQGATLWGFDMIAACLRLAPHIGHIHYSDSTGWPATIASRHMGEAHFFGLGDMHAPPGFGLVDFAALEAQLTVLPDTRIVIEIKSNFKVHSEASTLAAAQGFAAAVNARQMKANATIKTGASA